MKLHISEELHQLEAAALLMNNVASQFIEWGPAKNSNQLKSSRNKRCQNVLLSRYHPLKMIELFN